MNQNIKISDFNHPNITNLSKNCDIDAMWSARNKQFINFQNSGPPTTLYMTVFHFDNLIRTPGEIEYEITVKNKTGPLLTAECGLCENSETPSQNANNWCYCYCEPGTFGKTCSRTISSIAKSSAPFRLAPLKFNYFKIENSQKLNLKIDVTKGPVEVYVQYQKFENEVASYYNVGEAELTNGSIIDTRYSLQNRYLSFGATPEGRILLITLVNLSTDDATAEIVWQEVTQVSILVIVLSVLGGVLLVALVVAVICIVKRRQLSRVGSELNLVVDENRLTMEEIERFFPQMLFGNLIGTPVEPQEPETSVNQLDQKEKVDMDCIICLEPIKNAEEVRIGYCKHIFHSPCLLGWFKKMRNCPYCRKEYSRDETVQEYNKLKDEKGQQVLKNEELCKAIYSQKGSHIIVENMS